MAKTNVATIYGAIELDNKGFKSVLQQSNSQMAKTALEMQKNSRIKIDMTEWKKLSSQLQALQGRARETQVALLKAVHGSDEAKKLKNELLGLNERMRLLKAVTEPARKEMERLARAENAVANSGKNAPSSAVTTVAGTMGGPLGRVGQAMAFGGVYAAAAASALATAAAVKEVGSAASITAANIEMQTVAFETMLGSASKAQAFVKDLLKFAKNTPFEFSGLVENARLLMVFGFESKKILPILRVIGDAAGGNAEKIDRISIALGQMKAKTKVSANEMNQLTEAGISGWDMIAKKIGVDVPTAMKMAEQGQISAVTGINAILDGMSEKFGSGMAKASKTAIGSWSNIKDTVNLALADIGVGINNQLKPLMVQFSTWFPKAWAEFKKNASAMWVIVKPILKDLVKDIKELWPAIKLAIKGLSLIEVGKLAALAAVAKAVSLYLKVSRSLIEPLVEKWKQLVAIAQKLHLISPSKPDSKDKPEADPSKGDFHITANPITVDPAQSAAITSAATKIAEMKRELVLNGDASNYAAMQYAVLTGEFRAADEATKAELLSLAKQVDAQDAAREAAKKHKDEQKKLAEQAKQTAEKFKEHYAQNLEKALDNMRNWAGQMADAMKGFADETLNAVKDQLRKEREARDAAADEAKSKYEKLSQIGAAGAAAMTNIVMFGKKKAENGDITPADLTPDRMRKAAQDVQARRGNEAALTAKVQGALFGDSISRYEGFAKSKSPDMFGASLQEQVTLLQQLLDTAVNQLTAINKLSRVNP